jgi:hypothetical protein
MSTVSILAAADRVRSTLAIVLLAAAATSCQAPTAPSGTTPMHIEGRVYDAESGAPIAGASVWLGQFIGLYDGRELMSTTTAEDGTYALRFGCRREGFLVANAHRVDTIGATADGFNEGWGTPKCVSTLQTLHFALRRH